MWNKRVPEENRSVDAVGAGKVGEEAIYLSQKN